MLTTLACCCAVAFIALPFIATRSSAYLPEDALLNHELANADWLTEIAPDESAAFALRLAGEHSLVHDVQTPYQHIQVYQTAAWGYVMLIDGCIMLSSRDNFLYHEMMTHPALALHPKPEHVVIIGGGDCGSLREVLKHRSVQQARQIDIDEGVTRAAEQFFPELCESNNDPRAELAFIDGLQWMREADAGSVDVIIIDSTDPVGPAEGLFKRDFYADCYRALGEHGVIVQQSESPLMHQDLIASIRTEMLAANFTAVKTAHFPQPVYPSGWWSATLGGKGNSLERVRLGEEQLAEFDCQYYSAAMHQAAFTLPPFLRFED